MFNSFSLLHSFTQGKHRAEAPRPAAFGAVGVPWDDAQVVGHERSFSLHQTDLADALLLAETLGCLPPEVVFYGVQPGAMEWDQPLSPAVERALDPLLKALIAEVRSEN